MKKLIRVIVGVVLILGIGAAGFFLLLYQHTSCKRPDNQYTHSIQTVIINKDQDDDDIDDQTDILESALAYTQTCPKYKSRYYVGGYPNDGYGVCTDLVAAALKGAGYDLRDLVAEDIDAHPGDYDIEEVDPDIDYRRVRNLRVFLEHKAKKLSLNIYVLDAWQGGDIVVFENHIGIISDRRNKNGVPYVIHHNDPFQKAYEEDILEGRDDLVGHYRICENK